MGGMAYMLFPPLSWPAEIYVWTRFWYGIWQGSHSEGISLTLGMNYGRIPHSICSIFIPGSLVYVTGYFCPLKDRGTSLVASITTIDSRMRKLEYIVAQEKPTPARLTESLAFRQKAWRSCVWIEPGAHHYAMVIFKASWGLSAMKDLYALYCCTL